MVDRQYLLTTKQMAEFAHNGFLRFDKMVPRDLCDELYKLVDAKDHGRARAPCYLEDAWPAEHPMARCFNLPAMQGMIHSLVGPHCRYDHHHPHKTPGGSKGQQLLHQDAEYDVRFASFDVQISVFPQDTPLEKGGTRFLPGTQYRQVYETEVGRYRNVKGMYQCVCEAGTVVVWHHNLWHGAQPNHTDLARYMIKLRINPTVKQQLLWNTDDLQAPEVFGWLGKVQPWWGVEQRLELMNKIRFWRALTNNPSFDLGMWYTRVENNPQTLISPEQLGFRA
jgi:hypothetical protein